MEISQWKMKTTLGCLYLTASSKGLRGLYWEPQPYPFLMSLKKSDPISQILSEAVEQIEGYLSEKRREFSVPLDLEGTDFQKQVWNALLTLPYGSTASYKDIAKKISNEKAVRAVGAANGRNPICLIIPCHRVIASDGTLGGYVAGLKIKSQLLDLERPI